MTVIDQMGREVEFDFPPKRIVSLVPSQTEFLAHLGLEEQLVGITKFCIHPSHLKNQSTVIGGTKDFSVQKILALKPDLVIGNQEENNKELIEELEKYVAVWMSKIETVEQALQMMKNIGELVGQPKQTFNLIDGINESWNQITPLKTHKKVAYLIWKKPWMAAGGHTYIDDILKKQGFHNVFSKSIGRYPEFEMDYLAGQKPEEVFLSSEPYPFKDKHIAEIRSVLPDASIRLVDGEMFSWYGSRMLSALDYFKSLTSQIDK